MPTTDTYDSIFETKKKTKEKSLDTYDSIFEDEGAISLQPSPAEQLPTDLAGALSWGPAEERPRPHDVMSRPSVAPKQPIRPVDSYEPIFEKEPKELSDRELIRQMGGKMPGGLPTPAQTDLPIQAEAILAEQYRNTALRKLLKRGFKPEQIKLILGVEKELKPGLWQTFKPRIGQTTGGVAGGIAGAKTAAIIGQIPPLTALPDELVTVPLGATIGAFLGGATGKGAQVAIEEKRLPKAGELLKAGGEEGLYEAGGRYATMGLKVLFSPLIKKTIPEAAELMAKYQRVGGHFSPAQMDKRLHLKGLEAFSRGGFAAQEIWQKFGEKQIRNVHQFADELVDSIAKGVARKTPTEVGELFAESIQRPGGRVFQMLDDLFAPLYAQIDDLTKTATVSTKSLKAFATKELATDQRLNRQYLSGIGRAKLVRIIGMDDAISFSDMRLLRSGYLKDARKLARDIDKAQAVVKRLTSLSSDAMFDPSAAKGLTPEASKLLQRTNKLYKATRKVYVETFSERLAKRIAKNPAGVMKEVFPTKNVKAIRATKRALTRNVRGKKVPEGQLLWNQLRQAWLADTVESATKQGKFNPVSFDVALHKMGDEALREMFSPGEFAKVKEIGKLFNIITRSGAAGTVLFTKGLQIGGISYAVYSAKEGDMVGVTKGLGIALAPIAYVKLAMHPRGAKLLTTGLNIRPGSTEIGPVIVRMVNLLKEINAKEKKLQQTIERQKRKPTTREEFRAFGGGGF